MITIFLFRKGLAFHVSSLDLVSWVSVWCNSMAAYVSTSNFLNMRTEIWKPKEREGGWIFLDCRKGYILIFLLGEAYGVQLMSQLLWGVLNGGLYTCNVNVNSVVLDQDQDTDYRRDAEFCIVLDAFDGVVRLRKTFALVNLLFLTPSIRE